MAYDVFISYGHEDKLVADAACARLEAAGIRCWIAPRDLLPGQSYGQGIADALRSCRAFVLVFSNHANLSRHVANEVERAVHHNLPIVPLRIQDVKPSASLEYFIGPVHWLDALSPPLERHLEYLANSIQRLIGGGPVPGGPPTPAPPMPAAARSTWFRPATAGAVFAALVLTTGALAYFFSERVRSPTASTAAPPASTVAPVAKSATAEPRPLGAVSESKPAEVSADPSAVSAPKKQMPQEPPPERPAPVDHPAPPTSATTPVAAAVPVSSSTSPPPPVPAGSSTSASRIIGCWLYNKSANLRMHEDGRITGALDGARWTWAGANRFVLTGPPSTDTLVLAPDARSVTGSNNYAGPGVSGLRTSGDPKDLVGGWQWSNGVMTTVRQDGTTENGGVSGKWMRLAGTTYRIVWNYVFVDNLEMTENGQQISGRNQLGVAVGGVRVPCLQ